jgi:hypothetical protein
MIRQAKNQTFSMAFFRKNAGNISKGMVLNKFFMKKQQALEINKKVRCRIL